MYCKYCGQQIADDSIFCKYCGVKLDEVVAGTLEEQTIVCSAETYNDTKASSQEVTITTNDSQPLQIEVSKKTKNNSSTIANEIIGNLRMVGYATLLVAVYLLGFIIYHKKDIKEYEFKKSSYLGESCYDPVWLEGDWEFDWEKHYYDYLHWCVYQDINELKHSPEECLMLAKHLEWELSLTEKDKEILIAQAKIRAQDDLTDWNESINDRRKDRFKDDLKTNVIYASLFSALLMILGRYLIKLINWVNTNKTE